MLTNHSPRSNHPRVIMHCFRYRIDTALDVWSFGVVIYIVLFTQMPWRVASRQADMEYDRFVTETLQGGVVDGVWTVLNEPFRRCLVSMFDVS